MNALDGQAESDVAPAALPASGGRSLGRALAFLTSARFLQQTSSFVFGVLIRGLLGPTRVGVWNYVDAWRQQLTGMSFGLHYASDRDMPILRAQGRIQEEDELRWVTLTWMTLEALVFAVGFWIYWLVARGGLGRDVSLGLALVPALATLGTIVSAYEGFLVNRKHFELRAWLTIGLFVLDWTLLGFAWLGGLRALLWGLLVTWAVRVVVYVTVVRRRRVFTVRFTAAALRSRVVGPMLRFGFPVSIFSAVFTLLGRVDSLVIGAALGTTQLGLYYLGPQVAASLASLPNMLSVVSYPNLMEIYGEHGMERLKVHMRRFHQAMLLMSPIAAAIGVYGVQVLVDLFLPAFRPGLEAMKIVILTVVFSQTSLLSLQIFLATKRIARIMLVAVVALAVQGAVLGVGVAVGLTIEIVAWSAVAGQGAFAVISLADSARLAGVTRAEARAWAAMPFSWVAFCAVILGIDTVFPTVEGHVAVLGQAAAKLALFALVSLGLLRLLDRNAFRATRELMATRAGR